MTYQGGATPTDHRLPTPQRAAAAESKYAAAVALYAATDLPVRAVAEKCGVGAAALGAHIRRHHRDLLLERHGLDGAGADVKLRGTRGQSVKAHLKYKEAIEACGDVAYIEYNVSQVARMFGLDGTALASQLKVHYPDVIPARERLRKRLGIADNTHRGARPWSREGYEKAVAMYGASDLTLAEVATECGVSKSGLCQYMRFYHPDVLAGRQSRRKAAAAGDRKAGAPSGNGSVYGPSEATVARYAAAVQLYRTTDKPVDAIAADTGVPLPGLRAYLRRWHRGERHSLLIEKDKK